MDDFDSNVDLERHAEERAVDGLLREALRGDAGSDDSLERTLARVRSAERADTRGSAGPRTFRVAAAAALLIGLGVF